MAMAEGNTAKGLIYASIAAVTFALYTALGKLRIGRLGGMVQNSGSFLTASVIELIILLVRGEPIISGITLGTVPVVLYTGIVVTGIGYFAYLKAIELAGPSNASVAFFIKPVIAVILAAVILGESITWNIVAGVLLILIGSYINMSGAKKAAE
jgi:drug/metabolite transporter (DMT)-like permease